MKKTIFEKTLASFAAIVFVTVFAACTAGPESTDVTNISAARMVGEGLFYENRAQQFIANLTTKRILLTVDRSSGYGSYTGGSRGPSYKKPSIPEAAPNPQVTIQQAQVSTGPNDPYDFDIIQNKDGGITITKYKGSRTNVVIPATISGLRVTEIGKQSFASFVDSKYELESVVIPNTVTSIGESAFSKCKKLNSVTLPSSLTTIKMWAFYNCSSLTSIALPDSITFIGYEAFSDCSLTSITLPNRLTEIERLAFNGNRLTMVQLPASLKVVWDGAFGNNPLTTVVIPPSLARYEFSSKTLISTAGFAGNFGNSTLTSITMPANVDDDNLYSMDESFVNYYKLQGKKAGTYVKNDRIWKLQ